MKAHITREHTENITGTVQFFLLMLEYVIGFSRNIETIYRHHIYNTYTIHTATVKNFNKYLLRDLHIFASFFRINDVIFT